MKKEGQIMVNYLKGLLVFLSLSSTLCFSVDKIDPRYLVTYGSADADLKITEYISFSCPHCCDFIKNEFAYFKELYIKTKKVQWTFHVDPADKLTFQAMLCLGELSPIQKQVFLESMASLLNDETINFAPKLMQQILGYYEIKLDQIDDFNFLKKTDAYEQAVKFLKQDLKFICPKVEVNGKILKGYPDKNYLKTKLNQYLKLGV